MLGALSLRLQSTHIQQGDNDCDGGAADVNFSGLDDDDPV